MMNRTYRRVVGRLRRMGLPPYVLWGTMQWIGWLALGAPAIALANPADLEPSFGTGGKVTTTFPGTIVSSNAINAIALQTDGKIVAAGSIFRVSHWPATCRTEAWTPASEVEAKSPRV